MGSSSSTGKLQSFKKFFIREPFGKRMVLMLIGVIMMGVCVAFLDLTDFGTDPYSALNLGLSRLYPSVSFGTWELIVNGSMLFIVLFFDKSMLGFGTIGNMVIIGYTKDFTSFILDRCFGLTSIDALYARIIVMLIALTVFMLVAAIYMNAGLGASAYDALPFVITNGLSKVTGKSISFKFVRISFDLVFTTIAWFIGGEVGVMTVIMVFTLGPIIDFISKKISRII